MDHSTLILRNLIEEITSLRFIFRTMVAIILIASGLSKLIDYRRFVEAVRRFRLLPSFAVRPVAAAIPAGELAIGVGLCCSVAWSNRLLVWSGAPAIVLFAIFASAVTINLLRGNTDISCGCFGSSKEDKLTWSVVGRACCCLLASIVTLPLDSQSVMRSTNLIEKLSGILVGVSVVAAIWLTRLIRVAALPPQLESRSRWY